MIAGMADTNGAIRGVHATYLRQDGSDKADLSPARKMWGPMTGHAVWLSGAPTSERTHPLVSGEGIETVWGFIQRWGRPCRAAASLSLDNLQGFPLTPGGALPLWNPRIDPDRRCFTLPDPGDVIVLVDADMKPLRDRRVQLARGKRSEISDDHRAGAGAAVRHAGDATVATGRGAAGRGDPAADRHGLQRFGARCSMTTPTNDAPVTVEQCDADRALDYLVAIEGHQITSAENTLLASEFARHRLAALASAPAAGSREAGMVTLRTDGDGRPKVWCDPEIADLVDALNTKALSTVASCSGHGHRPGIIMLTDGRCLMVFRDREYAKAAEAAYPLDINGIASAPAEDGVEAFARSQADHWLDDMATPSLDARHVSLLAMAQNCIRYGQALARPRAAVGEREAWELPDLRDLHKDVERLRDHDLGNGRMRDLLRGAMDMLKAADVEYAALQSPPAKVEE